MDIMRFLYSNGVVSCSSDAPPITTFLESLPGVVANVGDGATHILPAADGYVIGSSIKSIPIIGKDVTRLI